MWMAIAGMAMQGLSMFANHGEQLKNWKAQKAIQEYKNKMTNIAAGQKQNAITTNVTLAIQASARKAADMQVNRMSAMASAEANAAASGVEGNAVDLTLTQIANMAGQAEHERQTQLETTFLQAKTQRRAAQLDAQMNQDISYLPKPELASKILGFGADAFSVASRIFGKGGGTIADTGGAAAHSVVANYERTGSIAR